MNSKEAAGQAKVVMGRELDMEAGSGEDPGSWEMWSGGEGGCSGMRDGRSCGKMLVKCFGGQRFTHSVHGLHCIIGRYELSILIRDLHW